MEIIIGRADINDAREVAKLFDAYRVFYEQDSDPELALTYLTERLENTESVIFYAQDSDGRCLGFTQLYPTFCSVAAHRTLVLYDLYVCPDSQSRGIGTLLLNRAKAYARDTGAQEIRLETAKTNVHAQRLYESLGYQKDTEYFSYSLPVE